MLLFTRVITRAVSIEITTNPDAESSLLVLGQFLRRRKEDNQILFLGMILTPVNQRK